MGASAVTAPATGVEDVLADLAAGRMAILADAERGGGALVMAAERVGAADLAFMSAAGRGWVSLALSAERCAELGLRPLSETPGVGERAAFTATIDACDGLGCGGAAGVAHTVRVAADPARGPEAIAIGGRVSPVRAAPGGVLERPGRAEAAVDMMRLAGLHPGALLCEAIDADGVHDAAALAALASRHGLRQVTIAAVAAHRCRREPLVERVVAVRLPTAFGEFEAVGYRSLLDGGDQLALVRRPDDGGAPEPVVRVRRECRLGGALRSLRCDCRDRLDEDLAAIDRRGCGALIYLSNPAGADPFGGCDGAELRPGAELGERELAAQILADLGEPLAGAGGWGD